MLIATQFSTVTAMYAMAVGIVGVGALLLVVNPAVRSEEELAAATGERVPRRSWLGPRMIAVLVIAAGAVFILAGTEVAIVAQLRSTEQLAYTGLVVGVWSAVSAVGGHRVRGAAALAGPGDADGAAGPADRSRSGWRRASGGCWRWR